MEELLAFKDNTLESLTQNKTAIYAASLGVLGYVAWGAKK